MTSQDITNVCKESAHAYLCFYGLRDLTRAIAGGDLKIIKFYINFIIAFYKVIKFNKEN